MMLYLDDFDQYDSDIEYAQLLQKQFGTDIDQQDPDIEYAKLLQKQFDADSERERKEKSYAQLEIEKKISIQEENDRIFAMYEQEKEINNRKDNHKNRETINNNYLQHPGFISNVFLQRTNVGVYLDPLSDDDLPKEEFVANQSDYSNRPIQDLCDELLQKEPEHIKEALPDDNISIAFSKLTIVNNVDQVKDCCCCLLEIELDTDTEYTVAICNHTFHTTCISKVFETKLECPMCNKYLG
jgi:hypothetical protein